MMDGCIRKASRCLDMVSFPHIVSCSVQKDTARFWLSRRRRDSFNPTDSLLLPPYLEADKRLVRRSRLGGLGGIGGVAVGFLLLLVLLLLQGARRSSGEVGVGESGDRHGGGGRGSGADGVNLGGGRSAADEALSLGRVVTHVLLGKLGDVGSVLLGGASDLGSLGVDKLGGVLELGIDELLVGGVDEGDHEDGGGANNGKTPVGNDLDEVVRHESSNEGL